MGVSGRGLRQGPTHAWDPRRARQAGIGGCITCVSSRQNRLCDLLGSAFSSGKFFAAIVTIAIFTSPIFATFPENPRLTPHVRQSLKRETPTLRRERCYVLFLIEEEERVSCLPASPKRRCRSTSARYSSSPSASRLYWDYSCCSHGCRTAS